MSGSDAMSEEYQGLSSVGRHRWIFFPYLEDHSAFSFLEVVVLNPSYIVENLSRDNIKALQG